LVPAITGLDSPLLELARLAEFYQNTRVSFYGFELPSSPLPWALRSFPDAPPPPLAWLRHILSEPFALFQRMNPVAAASVGLHGACSTCPAEADCLRLSVPSTLSESGVHGSRVCLALYVALSGFDYPLSGLLLPKPLSLFSDPSVPGIRPSELFSLRRAVPLSRPPALLSFVRLLRPKVESCRRRLQSFFPFEEPCLRRCCYAHVTASALLGFAISGALPF
jgi:hypothetical protein